MPPSLHRGGSNGNASTRAALETLLVDLGPQIQRGAPHPADASLEPHPTGLAPLDQRLGGGFPRGRLSEICGPASSGRTALALALLATTLERGGLAGWIDLADAFDPGSAQASGVDLERLLWVRARSAEEALRSGSRLLETEGFEIVILDCAMLTPLRSPFQSRPRSNRRPGRERTRSPEAEKTIGDVAWLRLARLAARTRTALVALSQIAAKPTTDSVLDAGTDAPPPLTGSRAELVLEMQPLGARFASPPSLLEGIETAAVLRRHRTRPSGAEIPLSVDVEGYVDVDFEGDVETKSEDRC